MSELAEINAILSASNIPGLADQAEQRERQAIAMKLAQQKSAADLQKALMVQAMKDRAKGNGFQGNSMDAQMLNIWNNPEIPADSPLKQQAQRYLSRPTTYTVGDQQFVRPGILGEETATDNPLSESERQKLAQLDIMRSVNASASSYVPDFGETVAESYLPTGPDSWFQSSDYRRMMTDAQAWSNVAAKLLYGAASDEEFNRTLSTYWPEQGDDPATIQRKANLRIGLEDRLRKGQRVVESQGGDPKTKEMTDAELVRHYGG